MTIPNYVYDTPSHMVRRMHQISVALFTNAMSRACLDLTTVQYAVLATLRDRPGIDQAVAAAEPHIDAIQPPLLQGLTPSEAVEFRRLMSQMLLAHDKAASGASNLTQQAAQ